jgi:hypothetical protein
MVYFKMGCVNLVWESLTGTISVPPLALLLHKSRYMTVTPKQALVSVGEWPSHEIVIKA